MRFVNKIFTFIGIAFFSTGCTPYKSYDVSVDSICTSRAKEKKNYVLLPGNKDTKNSDLQFQEFAGYTEKALHALGFQKASSIDTAEVAILLTYGISDPLCTKYAYCEPIYGHFGKSSSSSSTTIHLFGKSITYSENSDDTPSFGVLGSTTHIGTKILYTKHMMISGIDLEESKKTGKLEDAPQLWSTKAQSLGDAEDLREVFPVLLLASQKHLADNTGKKISYKMREDKKLTKKIQALKN
jgi:hypothetical protein